MVTEDISNLITELRKKYIATKVAEIFERERKWVYCVENGCSFRLDYKFIAGLSSLGYELKLVKKGEGEQ